MIHAPLPRTPSRRRRSAPLRGSWRLGLVIAVSTGLFGTVLASTPADAFQAGSGYVSDATLEAGADLEDARYQLLRETLGLSGAIEFDPGASLQGQTDPPEGGEEWEIDFEASASIDYIYDAVGILEERIDLLEAEQGLLNRQRNDVFAALDTHARLLNAQIDATQVARELDDARQELRDAEADGATPAELRQARLRVEQAELRDRREQRDLAELVARAQEIGLSLPATFDDPLRFALPEVPVEATYDHRQLVLALESANARYLRDTAFNIVDSVRISAGYDGTDAAYSASAGLDNGRPFVGLDASYRDDDEDEWTISIGAVFRIDSSTIDDFNGAEERLRGAEEALAEFEQAYAEDVAERLRAVDEALLEFEWAQRSLAIDADREVELEDEIVSLAAERDELIAERDAVRQRREEANAAGENDLRRDLDDQLRGLDGDIRDVERAQSAAERDLQRLIDGAERNLESLYGNWRRYVEAVDRYLETVDAAWALAE